MAQGIVLDEGEGCEGGVMVRCVDVMYWVVCFFHVLPFLIGGIWTSLISTYVETQ